MKLSIALRQSYQRKATHPIEGYTFPMIASDFGVEIPDIPSQQLTAIINGSPAYAYYSIEPRAWADFSPDEKRLLFDSDKWEPVDPKPAMLVIAEAMIDWTEDDPSPEDEKIVE